MKAHDWLKKFDHEGCNLLWCKFPFSGHDQWTMNYDCKMCKGDSVRHAQSEVKPQVLMLSISRSSQINGFPPNHHSAEDNPSYAPKLKNGILPSLYDGLIRIQKH